MATPIRNVKKSDDGAVVLRKPVPEDGAAVWELVKACSPLDENSMYCNLIQCDHFRDTCVVAEKDGNVVGWVSGHVLPSTGDTFFVWQVAVHEDARGLGLGGRMLRELMQRDETEGCTKMQTTITLDNKASWALFTKYADRMDAMLDSEPHYKRDEHFNGDHATEHMVTITMAEDVAQAA
ncbi:diaminobutyrate acetyltransferase [Pacificitalea manganoxidans]|mgnify:CR=1 FL=1|uniref:L-2,4-diaminobutyric acid acetyltransferase n=1 Tax=Pacificitalea manganoxidans TaxID=1411902 RepID=A0A291LXU5_9RHOB|nr:diaminobutyrate acetyltransferase [Pacificitalea manganoxidans]ATI41512.1 diaminobutyrate acetyltransferase [Pacificitalea manganoxidans]MAQ44491.1 diaminobutyrate acetyltransferase [Actibacterium sp.]MDR6308934.1 L-2,4-diaminobutyric acid acetyltransferase [Pacificitalea manganoxidans]|tara:strand:+ start:960 stop:1499 length:540 start_codon:yes stop_codon:yes gene_type:complete